MKRNYLKSLLLLLLVPAVNYAQVGVGTTDPKSQLDIEASSRTAPKNTDGILIPRIDVFPATNPTADQKGMLVYLTTASGANAPGFYYWDSSWVVFGASSNGWDVLGNTGTTNGTNFLGTKDAQALDFRTNDVIRARITTKGQIEILNTGRSVFVGEGAGANDDLTNNDNVFVGNNAGNANTTGVVNVAIGHNALSTNVGGSASIAIGNATLSSTSSSSNNIAIGNSALAFGTTPNLSIGIGSSALLNSRGASNIGIGYQALATSTTGNNNTAIGNFAAVAVNGNDNVTLGSFADQFNHGGGQNVVIGSGAGMTGGSGNDNDGNVLIGYRAGRDLTIDNSLYIENSGSVTPLVYGEFDNDIVRIGGQLQIGSSNNATPGAIYSFPTVDGASGEVLTTNGAGVVSWGAGSASSDSDWFEQGTSTAPNAITDNIYTNGNVGIGDTTPDGNLDIESTGDAVLIINADSGNSNESNNPSLQFRQDGGAVGANIEMGGNANASFTGSGDNDLLIRTTHGTSDIQFAANGNLGLTLRTNRQARLNGYTTATSFTGTATSILGVDAAGNVIQQPLSSGGSGTDDQNLTFDKTTAEIQIESGTNAIVSTIADADSDTKIQVEETADEDIIRFDVEGSEHVTINTLGQIQIYNTNQSVLLGEGAGSGYLPPARRNVLLGYNAGNRINRSNTTTAVGYGALANLNNWGTNGNSALGSGAMHSATSGSNNTAIGTNAMYYPANLGTFNVAIGYQAMGSASFTGGTHNVGVGGYSLEYADGNYNTGIGYGASRELEAGDDNTSIGHYAGLDTRVGSRNTHLGFYAGGGAPTGGGRGFTRSNSVYIGAESGTGDAASNRLYIESSSSSTPLIGGDFSLDRVGINVDMLVASALSHTLTVGGDVYASGDFITPTNTYPDYVFEDYFSGKSLINKDYKFMTLNEAIDFVKVNGHLPNVKSFKEVKENDMKIDLGATSVKNLEKIEENFLYIKEINEKNEALEKENKELKSQMSQILKRLEALENK